MVEQLGRALGNSNRIGFYLEQAYILIISAGKMVSIKVALGSALSMASRLNLLMECDSFAQ